MSCRRSNCRSSTERQHVGRPYAKDDTTEYHVLNVAQGELTFEVRGQRTP